MGPAKIQLRSSQNDQWYFVAIGRNGEDGPVSETYTRKADAIRAAKQWWPGVDIEAGPAPSPADGELDDEPGQEVSDRIERGSE